MKKRTSLLAFLLAVCMTFVPFALSGCDLLEEEPRVYVTDIQKTKSTGNADEYTVYYSDGNTSTFSVKNGEDGVDGKNGVDGRNGSNGEDGVDGESLSIDEIYQKYVKEYGEISYADFLRNYLKFSGDNSKIINSCLQSCLKVYTEFNVSSTVYYYGIYPQTQKSVALMCGSAVIYRMDPVDTYVLTNYHVVYNASANSDNGSNIAKRIVGYLYGSEGSPVDSGKKDTNGYSIYEYGDYALNFEYVGGSIDYDIAVLKIKTEDLLSVNENAKEVKLAAGYTVGETAIAIGNPENEGISVTEGIVSVDNEYVTLAMDNTPRNYRSIRIDTAIYGGSSGGGLFNIYGELIGITNAGSQTDENINYAIPIEIVRGVAENVLCYCNGKTCTNVRKITLGVTVTGKESKYVYDETTGLGKIKETVQVVSVNDGSIAKTMGLATDDILVSITINGEEYAFSRYFELGDILLNVRDGDTIVFNYIRNDTPASTASYTVLSTDL